MSAYQTFETGATASTIAPEAPVAPTSCGRAHAPDVRVLASDQLFDGFPEVQIVHGDAVYRLRRTSLGKLILTK
jgi:hemin uptake protein HemP